MPNVYEVTSDTFTFKQYFIACEAIFAVLPEWFACCLLCLTMLTPEGNKKLRKEKREKEEGDEEAGGSGAAGSGSRSRADEREEDQATMDGSVPLKGQQTKESKISGV